MIAGHFDVASSMTGAGRFGLLGTRSPRGTRRWILGRDCHDGGRILIGDFFLRGSAEGVLLQQSWLGFGKGCIFTVVCGMKGLVRAQLFTKRVTWALPTGSF